MTTGQTTAVMRIEVRSLAYKEFMKLYTVIANCNNCSVLSAPPDCWWYMSVCAKSVVL